MEFLKKLKIKTIKFWAITVKIFSITNEICVKVKLVVIYSKFLKKDGKSCMTFD